MLSNGNERSIGLVRGSEVSPAWPRSLILETSRNRWVRVSGKDVRAGGVISAIVCAAWLGLSAQASERPFSMVDGEVPAVRDEAPCTATSMRLPDNVRVDGEFLSRIRVMLRRSPTFREQCERLAAAPWVHVAVRLNPLLYDRQDLRAATTIQRPQPQLIVAVVSLQGLADPAMWVSHEFEHLIEQIEAIDLERLAAARIVAWPSGTGMFETLRAIRAGEIVLDEVRANEHVANFVDE